jgi:benzoylformate decarboxylase
MHNTVRSTTYDLLRSLGLKIIFGNPGSNELPFLKDMPSDFTYILALHERSAAGIALGYAMGKGGAAFVNLHSVASVGNGLAAIIDAYYCHTPLLVTAGQQDRRHLLAEPFLVSRAVEVVKPYVKWACEPLRAEDVPAAICRAYYLAMQPPRGPVFISIPMDDWNHSCEPIVVRQLSQKVLSDSTALDDVARAMQSSRRLAIVVGAQIEEDAAWDDVLALSEHLDADVYEEPIASRWTFPRNHPLFRGSLKAAQKPLSDQLRDHDMILVIGAPVFLYYTYVPGSTIQKGTTLAQITNSPTDASCALVGASVVGNIAAAAQYLRSHANPRKRVARAPKIKAPAPEPEYPITPAYLFSTLNALLPPNAIIAEECPSSKGDLDGNIALDEPGSFYSVRSGILGFGLPTAVGLQLARPDRRVISPLGDGSAQYSIQALWTAVQQKLPVIFIALRNNDYSALRGFCTFTGVGKNVPGIEISGIDLVKIAQGYGMAAREVDRPEDLDKALREAFASQSPCLVSVNVRQGGQKCMGMDRSVDAPNYG